MTPEEKIEDLATQLREMFPQLSVETHGPDVNIRWYVRCVDESDPDASLRFTVPRIAIDDMAPAEIAAVVRRAEDSGWWNQHPGQILHLGYDREAGLLKY